MNDTHLLLAAGHPRLAVLHQSHFIFTGEPSVSTHRLRGERITKQMRRKKYTSQKTNGTHSDIQEQISDLNKKNNEVPAGEDLMCTDRRMIWLQVCGPFQESEGSDVAVRAKTKHCWAHSNTSPWSGLMDLTLWHCTGFTHLQPRRYWHCRQSGSGCVKKEISPFSNYVQ